jgi:RNA polymerase sigma factor (sigma-70 family)
MNPDQQMDAILEGDRAAFLQLYKEYYHVLFAAGCYITDDKELIRDCMHQLFMQCWEKRADLPKVLHLKNYLTVALRNRILSALKQQNKLVAYDPAQVDENTLVEYSYEEILIRNASEQALQDELQQALASLAPRYREVIEMRFFRQYSYEDIARLTGQPVKTAYTYVYEALGALRKLMKGKAARIL